MAINNKFLVKCHSAIRNDCCRIRRRETQNGREIYVREEKPNEESDTKTKKESDRKIQCYVVVEVFPCKFMKKTKKIHDFDCCWEEKFLVIVSST